MSVFKRANWHSGLTYRNTCSVCQTTVTYTDDKLDFRPWFPDGFVYCPTCQKPLRHSEGLALGKAEGRTVDMTAKHVPLFCSGCGVKLRVGDNFCFNCGKKLSE